MRRDGTGRDSRAAGCGTGRDASFVVPRSSATHCSACRTNTFATAGEHHPRRYGVFRIGEEANTGCETISSHRAFLETREKLERER